METNEHTGAGKCDKRKHARTNSTVFIHAEGVIAQILGISRHDCKNIREKNLKRGDDWNFVNKEIKYSNDAVRRLLQLLEVSGDVERNVKEKLNLVPKGGKDAEVDYRELVVERTCKNSKIVLVRMEQEDGTLGEEILRVRVQDSKNFVKGMRMKCYHIQSDLWEFIGRCPRARGRW